VQKVSESNEHQQKQPVASMIHFRQACEIARLFVFEKK
jgi:hypothetical protein